MCVLESKNENYRYFHNRMKINANDLSEEINYSQSLLTVILC